MAQPPAQWAALRHHLLAGVAAEGARLLLSGKTRANGPAPFFLRKSVPFRQKISHYRVDRCRVVAC
jgi:hypothetical protein